MGIVKREIDKSDKEVKKKDCLQEKGEKIKNKGKLILDATCAPADIKCPTDLGMLNQARIETEKFELPFEGKLSPNNRWVIMAELIPWDDFEEEYAKLFSAEKGAPAKLFRMALGTLIIKEKSGTSDRETIEQIRENP